MRRPSLAQVFVAAFLAIAIIVATGFALFQRSTRASILESSERLREAAAHRVERNVLASLGRAQRALESVEHGVQMGAIPLDGPGALEALEAALFQRLVDDPHLEEVTLTRATLVGHLPGGDAELAEEGRVQLSVFRTEDGRIDSRLITREAGAWVEELRDRPADGALRSAAFRRTTDVVAVDPTEHDTFTVIANEERRGRAIWSDLHASELDDALAGDRPRIVLSVQKQLEDAAGKFVGVLRVGLFTAELDEINRTKVDELDPNDPHRVLLLCVDPDDKLGFVVHQVARIDPGDRLDTSGFAIRFVSDHPPPEVDALLHSPLLDELDPEHPRGDGALMASGQRYLVTMRELTLGSGGTTGWFTAILVPESHYTEELTRFQRRFLLAFAITLGLVLAIGGSALAAVRRGLGKIVATTARMRAFDFAAEDQRSAFADVHEVMRGLERAKTVARAMGRYIPVDLVRSLYRENREPTLGGELLDVSLLFTDIEGFTTLSETLPPDLLAQRLGDYLEAMTNAIESTGGTIDKYIGDAVMALWNAPTKVEHHEEQACRAVLACMEATAALYASPKWAGLPPLVTRYGVHRARVMIGNFGAPTRLSYTALGDGVNLAARLEPLCKQYGVIALVSDAIVDATKGSFVFRRVDRVAVKGKHESLEVFELVAAAALDENAARRARCRRYEEAFEAYLARDFSRAIELLEPLREEDPPSAVLSARCAKLLVSPPDATWAGVHVASSK